MFIICDKSTTNMSLFVKNIHPFQWTAQLSMTCFPMTFIDEILP